MTNGSLRRVCITSVSLCVDGRTDAKIEQADMWLAHALFISILEVHKKLEILLCTESVYGTR